MFFVGKFRWRADYHQRPRVRSQNVPGLFQPIFFNHYKMKLQPDNLDIVIPKHDWAWEIKFAIFCAATAWLFTGRPTTLLEAIVSCLVGGGILYVGCSGWAWQKFENHRNYLIYLSVSFFRIASMLFGLGWVVPYIQKLVHS